jgi:tetratricopeptide (TPR) repeat protein
VTAHPGDPGAPAAAHSWADALRDVGDPGAAKDALTELQELSEDRTDLIAPISLAWARLAGVPPESGAILELIAEDESLAAPDRAEALLLRAHLYRNQGDAPRARQVYEVLIRDVPGQVGAEAQEGLAETLSIEGRIDEAARSLSGRSLFISGRNGNRSQVTQKSREALQGSGQRRGSGYTPLPN